jgi:protease YdgD
MKATRLMMGSAALALALALGAPALAQDIDFGDNSSTWADDDQCDDPRFEGPGAALIRSPVDEMRDAADCQAAFEAGEITLAATDAPAADAGSEDAAEIDFGDDSGVWANDNECDDPRFGGTLDSHLLADATDCRTAYEAGDVTFSPSNEVSGAVQPDGDIDFGDDSGAWANDNECDDPRFGGMLDSHELADATDCRTAYEAGEVTYDARNDAGNDVSTGEIDFGDDSGTWANDGECDDPRFGGNLDSHLMADATDCREAYEAGTVTYQAPDNTGSDVSIDDIDFGDNSGNWANDGECDDPRFGGSLDSHLMADATDCREAYEAGTVTYETTDNAGSDVSIGDIDFGDDSGNWANDGECDDPRFGGGLDSHRLADATDCREALEAGIVTYTGDSAVVIDGIDFGDDSGNYSNDAECDDPRFTGPGVGVALDDHLMADATDCSSAYTEGTVTLAENGSNGDFRINFGDDSSVSAYDGVCDDPRFQGRGGALELLESNMLADASDCRAAHDAGTVTYNP